MPIRLMILALTLLGLFWFLAMPGPAQSPRTYEPFQPTAEYVQGLSLVSQGEFEQAVTLWKNEAARHPGTTLAAECLFKVAYYSKRSEGEAEAGYRSISAQFPQSRFDLHARQALINLQYGYHDLPGRDRATEALIREFGGPGLAEVQRAGDRGRLVARFQSLSTEIQQGLEAPYAEILTALVLEQHRYEEALPLLLFYREGLALDDRSSGYSIGMLYEALTKGQNPTGPAPPRVDLIDPQVRIKSPRDGHKKGPRPRFRGRVQVGDFRYNQVDMGRVQFLVDGVNLRQQLVVRSKVDPKLRVGRVFEKLKLTWRPAQPMAVGAHTIELVVPVAGWQGSGPGQTRVITRFEVRGQQDDTEDERDDDGEDWD